MHELFYKFLLPYRRLLDTTLTNLTEFHWATSTKNEAVLYVIVSKFPLILPSYPAVVFSTLFSNPPHWSIFIS